MTLSLLVWNACKVSQKVKPVISKRLVDSLSQKFDFSSVVLIISTVAYRFWLISRSYLRPQPCFIICFCLWSPARRLQTVPFLLILTCLQILPLCILYVIRIWAVLFLMYLKLLTLMTAVLLRNRRKIYLLKGKPIRNVLPCWNDFLFYS